MIPGFEAEVEAETRQELGLSAMAAMMAEPSPAGLEWRCFGYPYIYIRINIDIADVFSNSKIVFVFLVPGFGFDVSRKW